MAEGGLHRTIPALPVRDVHAAVAHYRDGNLLAFFRWS
jgi:hypothetical protein